jgi:hypothetical protein
MMKEETIVVHETVVKETIVVNKTMVIKETIVVTKSKPTKPGSHRSVRPASHEASHTVTRSACCEAPIL